METAQSKFGGYVGEYNGNLLKSSYEYIYAKILEFKNIDYKVEEETYLLDNGCTYYTPDFFLYDNNRLYEIIEIRGHRLNIEERIVSTNKLQELLPDVEIKLFTELDLRRFCKEIGLSYDKLKKEWRTNPNNIKGTSKGKANSMYGMSQKEETKKLISSVKKQKAKENPEKYRKLGLQLAKWCRERDYYFAKQERVPRFTLVCQWCGEEFIVIQGDKDSRKFCSNKCGSEYAFSIATQVKKDIKLSRDCDIESFIFEWATQNKDLVSNTPYNEITPTLSELLRLIKDKFNIIDFRTISMAIGVKGRKEFLKSLKDHVK